MDGGISNSSGVKNQVNPQQYNNSNSQQPQQPYRHGVHTHPASPPRSPRSPIVPPPVVDAGDAGVGVGGGGGGAVGGVGGGIVVLGGVVGGGVGGGAVERVESESDTSVTHKPRTRRRIKVKAKTDNAAIGAGTGAGAGAGAGVGGAIERAKQPMHAASYHQPQRPQGPWDAELDQWWAEVGLLLRKPILEEEDMLYTVAAAEAGLMYTDQMNEIATMLQVLRGALSRWILPYDNNTRIESQCSTPHSVVENMPQEFRGRLTERQVHYLVAGANGVRRLIRVKIADDNDLEQARKALKSLDMFFKALYHRAGEAQMLPYALLQMAESYVP